MGFWVILGHSLLEATTIVIMLLGFSIFLTQPSIVMGIGVVGGLILIWFGSMMLRDIFKGRVSAEFLETKPDNGAPNRRRLSNPVLGGIVVSMANPYWWVWWATIGMAL
jgi:threonine/homoserine/homoserine lactone efflux protein